MKFLLPAAVAVSLGTVSCDKVKSLADKARAAVETKLVKAGSKTGEVKPDLELQKLVDQTAEGTIFRKDLKFPTQIEVKTSRIEEISVRSMRSSALGSEAEVVKGTRTTVTNCVRADNQLRYTLVESAFSVPAAETGTAEDPKKPTATVASAGKPIVFQKTNGVWKADRSQGFQAAALSQTLSPVFVDLLVEHALSPRPLWFTGKRLNIGDQLTVTGKSLPMLVTGTASGTLKLTLKSFEPVNGHPCGVFEYSGNLSRKQVPSFDGTLTDLEITIESGKLWLSLVYPLVLREEADTIQTTRTGGFGGPSDHVQGAVKVTVTREWKATGQ